MISYPNCKINLGLNVVRRRPDGYHDLETIFLPAPLHDILQIEEATHFSFTQDGLTLDSGTEENLVVKAYRLMQRHTGIGNVAIHLTKKIPFGAGLGGGSSDATFTLCMLDKIFQLNLGKARLKEMASELGADCTFFVDNVPAYATGVGNILTPLGFNPIEGFELRIEKPEGETVSTSEAYRGVTQKNNSHIPLPKAVKEKPELWRQMIINDFEASVFPNHPRIAQLKQQFYDQGAIYASMTGSGAAVFGIFDSNKQPTI